MAGPSQASSPEAMIPFQDLRKTLDDSAKLQPGPRLQQAIQHRRVQLRAPWQLARPAESSADAAARALAETTVKDINGTTLTVEADRKDLAIRLASTAGISAADALVVVDGFIRDSQDRGIADEGQDQWRSLLAWYQAECLALPIVAMRLLDMSSALSGETSAEWQQVGGEVDEWPGPDEHLQQLFIGWAGLAKRELTVVQRRSKEGLYWARLQLAIQVQILQLLYLRLYRAPIRSAATDERLIRAVVQCGFGLDQANRDIWEGDADSELMVAQIRDTFTLIALEAMSLGISLDGDEDVKEASLSGDGDIISRVQMFLDNQSSFLQEEQCGEAQTPIAILLVGWTYILESLPSDRQPPPAGHAQPIIEVMRNRALREEANLVPCLTQIFTGSIVSDTSDSSFSVFARKALKDVLVAYGKAVPAYRISSQQADAINVFWSSLYSSGSPTTSLVLASDFWHTHKYHVDRLSVLNTEFPHDPVSLPRLLAATTGITSPLATTSDVPSDDDDGSPVRRVYDSFTDLLGLIVPIPGHLCRDRGMEDDRQMVSALIDMVLPGNISLPRESKGEVLRRSGEDILVVKWHVRYSGWRILLEILQVAVGLRAFDAVADVSRAELAVSDLGISRPTPEILASGLALLSAVLKPISGLAEWLIQDLDGRNGQGMALEILLEIVISALTQSAASDEPESPNDTSAILSSLEILTSLVQSAPHATLSALRRTQFFALPSKRSSPACELIRKHASFESCAVLLANLRLIQHMCEASVQRPEYADEGVLRAALHHVNVDIWQLMSGWTKQLKQEIAVPVCAVFEAAARHPLGADGQTLGAAATAVAEVFIQTATGTIYKPLAELIAGRQGTQDVEDREGHVRAAVSLLSTLLRLAPHTGSPASALPASLLFTVVGSRNDRLPLFDVLLSAATSSRTSPETSTAILRCLAAYIDTTANMPSKTSLVSQLADVQTSCSNLAILSSTASTPDQRVAGWKLLNAVMLSQPGAHIFCIGSNGKIAAPLQRALDKLSEWEKAQEEVGADVVSSLLSFVLSAISSPALYSIADQIHKDEKLWHAVFAIATRGIPAPPTFMLSRHEDDFAAAITDYVHATQARANGMALLAVEVELLADLEEEAEARGQQAEETVARKLLIGEFRNAGKLAILTSQAVRNGCDTELHLAETAKLSARNVNPDAYKTRQGLSERTYGTRYLYDGRPRIIPTSDQAATNTSFDMLNLNWTLVDADNALTRSFHRLAESLSSWTRDDGLAAKAALRAAETVAHVVASDERAGDVMALVQVERLWILATLLDTALDSTEDVDQEALDNLAHDMRRILDSPILSPIQSAREIHLPPVHRPLLRVARLLLRQAAHASSRSHNTGMFIETASIFILEAACAAFDAMTKEAHVDSDLVLSVEPLIELINTGTSTWIDQLAESGLIQRSLTLIKRMPKASQVPTYIPSILLFHLALANHPAAAEKLAVSGIIPAYSENAVTVLAEEGQIKPDSDVLSRHSAWCGMLLVVQSLLVSLPEPANFARDQVASFVRLTIQQVYVAFDRFGHETGRDGKPQPRPLTRAILDELRLVVDVLFGLSNAIPGDVRICDDFQLTLVNFLATVTHKLYQPRQFSDSVVPATAEEHASLTKELEVLDKQPEGSTVLVNFGETPVLGGRVAEMLQIAQMALRALVGMTDTWAIMRGQKDAKAGLVLETDEVVTSAITDPVGKISDLQSAVTALSARITAPDTNPASALLLQTCHHIAETCTLLAGEQILVRRSLLLRKTGVSKRAEEGSEAGDKTEGGMVIDSKPSPPAAQGKGLGKDKGKGKGAGLDEAVLLEDLEREWREAVEGPSAIGDRQLGSWLEACLERTFSMDE